MENRSTRLILSIYLHHPTKVVGGNIEYKLMQGNIFREIGLPLLRT